MYAHAIAPSCSFALKPLVAAVLVVFASGLHAAPSFNGSPGNNIKVETGGSTTTVTQSATESNRALANWNELSVRVDESLVFVQPNSNSVILNRVLGSNPSEIFGRLSANGRVFLINPNGIVFGANSEVNVGGLLASTLTLKPGFQNKSDRIEFELTDGGGSIISHGTISAKDIAFLSPEIRNHGILNAHGAGAAVHLIAASQVTANTSGTDLVLNVLAGHEKAVINQLGDVFAQGGKIVLIARSQTDGQASVINTSNIARASHMTIEGDVVRLTGEINLADPESMLQVTAKSIEQTDVLQVGGEVVLQADTVNLQNAGNDFKGVLNLNVSDHANVRDTNDLKLTGQAKSVDIRAGNTLTLGGLQVEGGSFSAETIHLNWLSVQDAARLEASLITQTQAAYTSGQLSLTANTVSLTQAGNDFAGELIVNSKTAHIIDANDLNITFAGRDLTTRAVNLNLSEVSATGSVVVLADKASIASSSDLSLQGEMGVLNVQARHLTQDGALQVRGPTRLTADSVGLAHQSNDFRGEVILNVAGNAVLNDQNSLEISGRVQGAAQFSAESLGQRNALVTDSDLLLKASQINLGHRSNSLGGASSNQSTGVSVNAVQLQGASQAVLTSQGNLNVQGTDVGSLTLTAQAVELGPLGSLQHLNVVANDVRQSAAIRVEGSSNLTANNIDLRNLSNDFVGRVKIQAYDAGVVRVALADSNSLDVQGENLQFGAQVQGDLSLQADEVVLNSTVVQGATTMDVSGALTQNQALVLNNTTLFADKITLNHLGNRLDGLTRVLSGKVVELGSASNLNLDVNNSAGAVALMVQGNAAVSGGDLSFADSVFHGDLAVSASNVSQTGNVMVKGYSDFMVAGGVVNLQNANNRFEQAVSMTADQTNLSAQGDLRIKDLNAQGGAISAEGRLILQGQIEQTGGTLSFTAKGIPRPLSSAEIALMLPPELDVFSSKDAVDPLTGLGRIALASAAIQQVSGQIITSADSSTQFKSTQNGSVVLASTNQSSTNQINGQFEALAGQNYGQAFVYQREQGASLFAVNNDVQLRVARNGIESDVVAIRSRGLATVGGESLIRARMPYNDAGAGTSRSYAGLTLSIPLKRPQQSSTGVASFGESSGVGQQAAALGAIRVEVGELNQAGLGGFVTVLPFEGSNLLPGQVVYLAGPEHRGTYAFFYDGARNLDRVPVVYNGSLLRSPQENAALTTAQGAVVLARQEQTRSVVRTENVAGKIINGVVAEVGSGRPATEGEGGAGKPDSCDAAGERLTCNP